ncbi:M23 family metallopeptidase [Nocardioidaceae bacterium]|nr:M23 family metallopeptidase [Nocardioidaceae bacterium]
MTRPDRAARRPRRRRGTAAAAVVALGLIGFGGVGDLGGTPAAAIELTPGGSVREAQQGAATEPGQRGEDVSLHEHEGDDAAARRAAEDRALAMAATWKPDMSLLAPHEGDSEATAALRAELADSVTSLRQAFTEHEKALRRSDRAARRLEAARSDVAVAVLATSAARLQVQKDRDALMALMAETYRNGSAGSLSLMLGGSSADRDERYAGEGLFSGLTLLSQMSSSQDDALRTVRRSARELARVQAAEEQARDRAEQRDASAADALRAAERVRASVVEEVEGIQDLVRQSVLRDEVKRRQAAALAERDALLAEDRSFLEAFSGLSPAASDELMRAAARLAAASPGGVVFPLPENASWYDNDNWGGDGGLWAAGHTGDDFSAPCGTPVLAATRGTVTVRTDQAWSGRWLVVVQGDDGVAATWYAHMQELLVADGDRVKAGQRIGAVGTEGNSTGCHLHFEVHPLGGSIYEDNVDPVSFLRLSGAYPTA